MSFATTSNFDGPGGERLPTSKLCCKRCSRALLEAHLRAWDFEHAVVQALEALLEILLAVRSGSALCQESETT